MQSKWRLRFGAFGAFLGISAYKRLEIQNKYMAAPSVSPGDILRGCYNRISTPTTIIKYVSNSVRSNEIFKGVPSDVLGSTSVRSEDLLLVAAFLFVNFVKWAIFGRLSHNEIKTLRDKVNYTIWEFCFGFMIFYSKCFAIDFVIVKGELLKFAGLFSCVLLLKSFHYLAEERVNAVFPSSKKNINSAQVKYMAIRFAVGLVLLVFIDVLLISRFFYEVYQRFNKSPASTSLVTVTWPQVGLTSNSISVDIEDNILLAIFGFEILYMFPLIISTSLQFTLNFYEYLRFEGLLVPYLDMFDPHDIDDDLDTGDEDKQEYEKVMWNDRKLIIIYTSEFITTLSRFFMIALFSMVFLYVYTFPFHILPSSYSSFRLLIDKTRRLVDYKKKQIILQKLTTPEESEDLSDPVQCIICYDQLVNGNGRRILRNCKHEFHYNCLKTWIDYSTSCPICRKKI